jgi:hypothetical protein
MWLIKFMTQNVLRTFLFAVLGAALVHGAPAQAPAMPPGTNVLLGRVVEIGSDAPVGGALVTVIGHFDASGKPATPSPADRDTPLSVNVMATPDGYFVVRNLPAGRFTATTRAFGYLNNDYPPTVLEIRDSQKPTEVQLHLWKYAAMAGRVVDDQSEPITGVVVSALRRISTGGNPTFRRVANGITDDRGEYRLSQLDPGDYVVGVLSTTTSLPENVAAAFDPSPSNRDVLSAMRTQLIQSGFIRTWGCPICISNGDEGYHAGGFVLQRQGSPFHVAPDGRLLGFANTFYPGMSDLRGATMVTLGSGESRTGLDLPVELRPTVVVAGVLTGPDGPMPNVALNLAPPGADLGDLEAPGIATAITNAHGAFTFLGITPGDYTLAGGLILDMTEATGKARPFWTQQALNVGDAGITGLAVAMRPGVRIEGRVELNVTSGVTSRSSQRQVVSLQPVRAVMWRSTQAVVQSDGTFRSAGDPPGRYVVNASSPPGWFWHSTSLAGKPILDEIIELGSTEVSGLVVTFGERTNRVSGLVSDVAGAPDADAAVIVFPADSTTWRESIFSSRRERKVLATSAGAYEIATLAPGDYYVAAVSARVSLRWQEPQFLERLIAGATRISLGVDDQKIVPLRTLTLAPRGAR